MYRKYRERYSDAMHQRVQHGMVKILIPMNISESAARLIKQITIEDSRKQAHIHPDEESKCHSLCVSACA